MTRIPQKWIVPVWALVFLNIIIQLTAFVVALPVRIAELATVCTTPVCNPLNVTAADVAALEEMGLSLRFYAQWGAYYEMLPIAFLLAVIVLLAWKANDRWVAVIAALAIVPTGGNVVLPLLASSTAPWLFAYHIANLVTGVASFLLIAVFPDGRFFPRWSKPVFIVYVTLFGLLIMLAGDGIYQPFAFSVALRTLLVPPVFLLGVVLFLFMQIQRYRFYYTLQQKQQVRWIIVAVVIAVLMIIFWIVVFETNLQTGNLVPHGRPFVLLTVIVRPIQRFIFITIFPAVIAIAIMRYRLWGVDIIIRRTLQYATVTGILAAVYFGTVVLLQSVFRGVVGAESPLVVVLSTLLIAALFNPVRGRVQRIVDRRFYRQRYDAEQVLAAFSSAMRDEVNLEQIEHELLATVSTTLEPEHVSLWVVTEQKN